MKKRGNDNNPVILLSHNPDVYMKLPKGISITLSGHTHGGQIYIPFIANLVNPSRFGRKFLSGHVVRDDNHFYVGKGLGTTIIPARLFAQPEITILRFE
ncbi:MAG: metallophosphoesterase [Candidatus Gastranaerophilales bacterium]|nr:metallophosphoesterase [Candidatus Gastranaerophilales bacterium]